ncbi:MAG: SUMF1/EgtB/PvdO family nonheme iron enzyme [Polyangiaceae bacterium]|nr:SUMF1/EgtB/PvdO family nonheme iron enzyme [Polyangiaceae bacterium]
MTASEFEWLLVANRNLPTAAELLRYAENLESHGQIEAAASALDAAFAVDPTHEGVRIGRADLLSRLQVEEHGLVFRYIPSGPFLMGSTVGDPDEQPVHPVELTGYWITHIPITWSAYHALMGWDPPPFGAPPPTPNLKEGEFDQDRFSLYNDNKIRAQYCETETLVARDWHAHNPNQIWRSGDKEVPASELFGEVKREDAKRPWTYDQKPMVAMSVTQAEALGAKLSTKTVSYALPTEAQWEKAARGGLVGKIYPWGDEPPTLDRCDFGRFDQFSIKPPTTFPPNAYGVYATAGTVREWTADGYDALAYNRGTVRNPIVAGNLKQRVLRGGSWADCASAVRVAFRMGMDPVKHSDPTIGFRLVRLGRASAP